eukprot:TRINITY_DN14542_c0_g1_i1.p1 TRINITY_DN14542_c0_g1~~TRINITY_DN14542_c0_g1_i1.p1  ORF type:complete len:238 (-),score=51.69 TRINITY_DN14542_c0_g1_i1:98-811(-)
MKNERTHQPLMEAGESGPVLYEADFSDVENFLSYKTWHYVLLCLGTTFIWGVGFLGLFWLPVMRHIWRRDFEARRLYVTAENIVYTTNVPVCMPCCGTTRREKHILLSLVTDVILEQGCLQAKFGLQSVSLENAGQANPNQPGADVNVVGMSNARTFKRAVLAAATAKRGGRVVTGRLIEEALASDAALPVAGVIGGNVGGGVPSAAALETLNKTMSRVADLLEAQLEAQSRPSSTV